MLNLDDKRWGTLTAGYRIPVDLRPLLRNLELADNAEVAWSDLWQELYHQGDVGEGSFIAVPHLVRIHQTDGKVDWNTYAVAATIELARNSAGNPDVPLWAKSSYDAAFQELRTLALEEFTHAQDTDTVRSILGFLAILHGARTHGRILIDFSEDEVLELEKTAFGDPSGDAG